MDFVRCRRRCRRRRRDSRGIEFSDILSNESLLIQILARLPCRDAIRFKLVCKRWCSLISSEFFISFFIHCHHRPSSSSPPTYTLAFQFRRHQSWRYDHSLLVHCDLSTTHRVVRSLDLSFLPCIPRYRIAVRASCDDLILCSFRKVSKNRLYLCIPQTKQYVALPPASPPPVDHIRDFAVGLLCNPAPCSFCRDQGGVENTHYKFAVMRIHVHNNLRPVTEFQVQLFSSEEGKWRNYVVSSSGWTSTYLHMESMVPYKGKLHWLNYPYVFVFDPYNAPGQVCRVIDLPFAPPDALLVPRPLIDSFGVFNDRLRVAYTRPEEMWHCIQELEDYNTGEWSLAQKLDFGGFLSGPNILPSDGDVVSLEYYTSGAWLCHFRNDGKMDDKYELIPRSSGGKVHEVSSLQIADQCWPTPIPSLQLRP